MPFAFAYALITALVFPKLAAAYLCIYTIGRIVYAIGYGGTGPESRIIGTGIISLANLAGLGLSVTALLFKIKEFKFI